MKRKILQADIGRALGISRQRVHTLRKRGMPTHTVAAARAWRAEHLDADLVKADPKTAEDSGHTDLKRRLLAAEVSIREARAQNENGLLPADKVERGIMLGLQLLRGGLSSSSAKVHLAVSTKLGEKAAREMMIAIDAWWDGTFDAAANAILLGLQREMPTWGRGFRDRYIARLRGNFPDEPVSGEPQVLPQPASPGNGELHGD